MRQPSGREAQGSRVFVGDASQILGSPHPEAHSGLHNPPCFCTPLLPAGSFLAGLRKWGVDVQLTCLGQGSPSVRDASMSGNCRAGSQQWEWHGHGLRGTMYSVLVEQRGLLAERVGNRGGAG